MTVALNFALDGQGKNTFSPRFTDEAAQVDLDASSPTPYTIPGTNNTYMAVFTYEPGAEVWVANGATAEVPPSNAFTATVSCQNPTQRTVDSGDILSFITPNASTSVGIELFAVTTLD